MYILPSMPKALLGQFCCVSNFVHTHHCVEFVLLATRWM